MGLAARTSVTMAPIKAQATRRWIIIVSLDEELYSPLHSAKTRVNLRFKRFKGVQEV
jgi:hypothetical protein